MTNARELKSGFHIAVADSKMTPTGAGVFIPYDLEWGKRMKALRAFIAEYYDMTEEDFPAMFEDRLWLDEKIAHVRRLQASQTESHARRGDNA